MPSQDLTDSFELTDPFAVNVKFIQCRIGSDDFSQKRPVRQELLSHEALILLARTLSKRYKVTFKEEDGVNLQREYNKHIRMLKNAYLQLSEAEDEKTPLPTGSEWIVDNYPLLEQHANIVHRFLKGSLNKVLPKIDEGPYKGYPRIYLYTFELLQNTDSSADKDILNQFIYSSQHVEPLTMRELWAFPIMFRLVLFASLASLAQFNLVTKNQSEKAGKVIDEIFSTKQKNASDAILSLAKKMQENPSLWSAGSTVYLLQKLRERGSPGALCIQWLKQNMEEMGCDPQTVVSDVLHLLSTNQISISHCFSLFRKISIENWEDWFEEVSLLHGILRQDPAGIYEKSNFSTRNLCRSRIEKIAKVLRENETEVGKKLIAFTKEKYPTYVKEMAPIFGSVCYYLIDEEGIALFEKHLNVPISYSQRIIRWSKKNAFPLWLSSFFLTAITITMIPILHLYSYGASWFTLISMSVLMSILASEISYQFLQWMIFHFVTPKPLPKLSIKESHKEEYQTLVTIQTIFTSREKIHELVEELEIHCLSNNEQNIQYGIVADFVDAKEKQLAEDKDLEMYAKQLIDRLNSHLPKYFLFTRDRKWSSSEQLFIGWERKRGKIHEINQFILGREPEDLHLVCGNASIIRSAKYIITLDEDTRIPPGNAAKLIATIAHPLNKAVFDNNEGKIVRGYAIIQPSLDAPFGKSMLSKFSDLFSEAPGTDPYSRLISNITQDLFDVGSYVGKGIYDVSAFEKSLKGWIPEGRILSHDLLEGSFARAGLASDINLLDSFPLNYRSFAKRLHRWTRGDWQLLWWIFSKIPNEYFEWVPTPLSPLRRWILLDNLRRSLVTISALIVLIAGFSVLPGHPLEWFTFVFLAINLRLITTALDAIFIPVSRPEHIIPIYFRISHELKKQFKQSVLRTSFIPALAYLQADAIITTLYRLFFSHKHFLVWTPTASYEEKSKRSITNEINEFLNPLILTTIIYTPLGIIYPYKALFAAPLFLLWYLAPWLAYSFDGPPEQKVIKLNKNEKQKLISLAWDTWKYFDEQINEKTNFLVPDNIQMVPKPVVAMRTSPTNIGFQFMCGLSAYDFGFICAPDMLHRFKKAFETIDKLEKFKGHLYNWYDISTLRPLYPKYVSTVDSGNLICFYITLRSALKDLTNDLIFTHKHWNHLLNLMDDLDSKMIKSIPGKMDTLLSRLSTIKEIVEKQSPNTSVDLLKEQIHNIFTIGSMNSILEVYECLHEVRKQLSEIAIPEEKKHTISNELTAILRAPIPTWKESISYSNRILELIHHLHPLCDELKDKVGAGKLGESYEKLKQCNKEFFRTCTFITSTTHELIDKCTQHIQNTDFNFLYSPKEKLLTIGYQVESNVNDPNYYTFLASESCLTSLIAVAKGDVEPKHWFALGRQLVKTGEGKCLLSWSGSTFEYLMPFILINPLPKTLLRESYKVCVLAQIQYGKSHNLPWGISESGYGITDIDGNYQYRGFGIPELGLKRGLHEDLVISPYSTILSLSFAPKEALDNIAYLEREGARGKYGFYESIDYTPSRLTKNEKSYVLESHLGHHQGMILTSINNFLNNGILQKRFEGCAHIEAFTSFLEEQFPFHGPTIQLLKPKADKYIQAMRQKRVQKERFIFSPHTPYPDTHVLSNGKLSEMIDNSGSGYLFYKRSIALTRWKSRPISNDKGYYIFIKDVESKEVWSLGYQPTRVDSKNYEVIYSAEKVTILRSDFGIDISCEITISPENNAEIRKLTFTNKTSKKRKLEITSYGEVTLTSIFSDINHPTFSNMFIESEFNQQYDALIFRRVPRSEEEKEVFLGHMIIYSVCWSRLQWDTNRRTFIGRNNNIHNPEAMKSSIPFLGGSKRTLDPIFSLRPIVELNPNGTESISFVTTAADTKDELIQIIKSYFSPNSITRAFEMSLARSNVEVRYEQIPIDKIHLFQEFSRTIFFYQNPITQNLEARINNRLQQESLWRFGISGDFPIVLVVLTEQKQISMLKDLMTCHQYLDRRCLNYDLVIINEIVEGYRAEFHDELLNLLSITSSGSKGDTTEKRGGIYILKRHDMSQEEINLLESLAQECYTEKDDKIVKVNNAPTSNNTKPIRESIRYHKVDPREFEKVQFYNGRGGFIDNGKAYRIFTSPDRVCPHPWSNIIGSKSFGFLITETGGGYTWSENCQENRLTPWSPDPITDPIQEAIFIRDSSNKQFFSIMSPPSIVENHFGYTSFHHDRPDIETDLIVSGSLDKKVKWWKLKISNKSLSYKQIEVFLFVDLLLGTIAMKNKSQLITDFDSKFQIIHATNNYNGPYSGRSVFIGSSETIHSFTTSKREFIGRNLSVLFPAALCVDTKLATLKNQISSGNDGVGVIHLVLQVPPAEEKEVLFFLGEENTLKEARESSISYKSFATWTTEWEKVKDFWKDLTNKIQVKTDDASFDILVNGWLLYQTLSCRLLAKTGYYQCSGAIGFRDQLQDSMALLSVDPMKARSQLLLHASRQFVEGDVQHWWNPQSGKGIRTRFSDDYLWMPYSLLKYLEVTGDYTILDEEVPFLEGEQLKENQQEIFFQPKVSSKKASLYDHCIIALDRALTFGIHGLPLMGCGDWNDGMNEVGVHGKGESVWLGWFLYDILNRFQKVSELKNDLPRANNYKDNSENLLKKLEESGWDGDWYRRAYFDDGTPLGSKLDDACEIDSISQSWAVISQGAMKERQVQSIASAIKHLVKVDSKVIRLLTPPFGNTKLKPGYIKAYPEGVRENGAQYTHAATWLILATAMLGKGNQAYDLFKMINPINHTLDNQGVEKYRGEPYVICGDVYSEPPYDGQAGWTWYTGAAGWLYTIALEQIIGFKIRGDHFTIDPCIPAAWKNFEIKYRRDNILYVIRVSNPEGFEHGVKEVKIDGKVSEDKKIKLNAEASASERTVIVEVLMGAV